MRDSRRSFLATSAAGFSSLLLASGVYGERKRRDFPPDANVFLIGDFEPVREESTVVDLKIEGKLPTGLNGFFLRTGPNPQFTPKNKYHVFDGDGMIHGIHLDNGKATYRNRYVRTAVWQQENRAGEAVYPSILDEIDWKSVAKSLLSGGAPVPNRGNTALVWHHGKLLALWEGGFPHEITLPELNTVGLYNMGKQLSHNFTAHPKVDPESGELIFYGYQPVAPHLQYSVADRDGKVTHTTAIPLSRPAMIHDAAITKNFSVFLDCPLLFDLQGVGRGKPMLKWSPELGARIGVLPRYGKGDETKWFDIDACFVFHVFNAYEQGDEVVLHACRFQKYPGMIDFAGQPSVENIEEELRNTVATAYTWRMNLKTGQVIEKQLDETSTEFPQVNPARVGGKTRFGYATAVTDIERFTLYRYDFDTGNRLVHQVGEERVAGEAIFVPRDGATNEQDGYLLCVSFDRVRERSELLVINGNAFEDAPVARVIIPKRIPAGFHAAWVPMA